MTSKQRAYLRGLANGIDGIFQVGKLGITPELTTSIEEALEKRELIKITVLNNCTTETKEVAETVAQRTRSDVVQVIGKKIVLFRQSRTNQTIKLPAKANISV
jgi:RNA-binding protein